MVYKQYEYNLKTAIKYLDSFEKKREVLLQTIEAVKVLHDFGLINHNIKPENLLFDSSCTTLVLCDFDCSENIENAAYG